MRRIQFPQGGGDKPIGGNNVNNQNRRNTTPKNNDLANALSGKSAPKFADPTDAMEQLLADPTNESLRLEVMGFIKSSVPEDVPEEEEDIVINAEATAEATAEDRVNVIEEDARTVIIERGDGTVEVINKVTGESHLKRIATE